MKRQGFDTEFTQAEFGALPLRSEIVSYPEPGQWYRVLGDGRPLGIVQAVFGQEQPFQRDPSDWRLRDAQVVED